MADQWTVEIEDHKSPDDWYAAAIWEHRDDGSIHIVGRVPQSEHGWNAAVRARDEANAHLIAAAPELLAALLAVGATTNDIYCWCLPPLSHFEHEVRCKQTRAVIAKALGKEASRAS